MQIFIWAVSVIGLSCEYLTHKCKHYNSKAIWGIEGYGY
jgi:hypothetical protein